MFSRPILLEFETVIVGGGILGLLIAELCTRCGIQTLLIEKNNELCQESSGKQHGWFHTGILYSLENNQDTHRIFIENIKTISNYYRHFKNMNLFSAQNLIGGWFNPNNRIDYYLQKDEKLGKKDWVAQTDKFKSHLFEKNMTNLMTNLSPEIHLNKNFSFIKSLDSTFNSNIIINDILSSALNNGLTVFTGTSLVHFQKTGNDKTTLTVNDNRWNSVYSIYTKKLVFATGASKTTKRILLQKVNFSSHYLSIITESIAANNFTYFKPGGGTFFNVLTHKNVNKEYSVVENIIALQQYYKTSSGISYINEVSARAAKHGKSLMYKCNKLHIELQQNRNHYLPKIIKINNNVWFVSPGKFSLSFYTAVNFILNFMCVPQLPNSISMSVENNIAHQYFKSIFRDKFVNNLH